MSIALRVQRGVAWWPSAAALRHSPICGVVSACTSDPVALHTDHRQRYVARSSAVAAVRQIQTSVGVRKSVEPSLLSSGDHSSSVPTPNTTIVLIGWLGCKQKNLDKYAQMHESSDFHVRMYRPSALSPLIPSLARGSSIALLRSLLASSDPLIFHAMSNNGAYHLAWLMHLLHEDGLFTPLERAQLVKRVRGIIFDSAPSALSPNLLARGYLGFLSGMITHRPTYSHPTYTPLLIAAFRTLLHVPFFRRKQESLSHSLHHLLPSTSNLLYIFSAEDALIPHQEIESHASEQAAFVSPTAATVLRLTHPPATPVENVFDDVRQAKPSDTTTLKNESAAAGAPLSPSSSSASSRLVATYRFIGSGHVQHFRRFPEPYQALTRAFVQKVCLQAAPAAAAPSATSASAEQRVPAQELYYARQ